MDQTRYINHPGRLARMDAMELEGTRIILERLIHAASSREDVSLTDLYRIHRAAIECGMLNANLGSVPTEMFQASDELHIAPENIYLGGGAGGNTNWLRSVADIEARNLRSEDPQSYAMDVRQYREHLLTNFNAMFLDVNKHFVQVSSEPRSILERISKTLSGRTLHPLPKTKRWTKSEAVAYAASNSSPLGKNGVVEPGALNEDTVCIIGGDEFKYSPAPEKESSSLQASAKETFIVYHVDSGKELGRFPTKEEAEAMIDKANEQSGTYGHMEYSLKALKEEKKVTYEGSLPGDSIYPVTTKSSIASEKAADQIKNFLSGCTQQPSYNGVPQGLDGKVLKGADAVIANAFLQRHAADPNCLPVFATKQEWEKLGFSVYEGAEILPSFGREVGAQTIIFNAAGLIPLSSTDAPEKLGEAAMQALEKDILNTQFRGMDEAIPHRCADAVLAGSARGAGNIFESYALDSAERKGGITDNTNARKVALRMASLCVCRCAKPACLQGKSNFIYTRGYQNFQMVNGSDIFIPAPREGDAYPALSSLLAAGRIFELMKTEPFHNTPGKAFYPEKGVNMQTFMEKLDKAREQKQRQQQDKAKKAEVKKSAPKKKSSSKGSSHGLK